MSRCIYTDGRIEVEVVDHKNGYFARIYEPHTGCKPRLMAETSIRDTRIEALQEAIAIIQRERLNEPVH